jgi:polyisoprenyl-phosphate glycosyltransferase
MTTSRSVPEDRTAAASPDGDLTARSSVAVVIPLYNERESIDILVHRFEALATSTPALRWILVFVDDGSVDGTTDRLLGALRSKGLHLEGRVIELSRNFGKEAALTIGFEACDADFVATVDADLQDPPELIPRMLELLHASGADVVCGQRLRRHGESALRRFGAYVYYRLAAFLADVRPDLDVGDFRLMRREVVDALCRFQDRSRFMKSIYVAAGFRRVFLPYDRDPRAGGQPKLSVAPLVNLAIDGITSLSIKPLRVSTYLGFIIFSLSIVTSAVFAFRLSGTGDTSPVAWLMVLILMTNGLLFVLLGFLGEYVGRILIEVKQRPLAVVRRDLAFAPERPLRRG